MDSDWRSAWKVPESGSGGDGGGGGIKKERKETNNKEAIYGPLKNHLRNGTIYWGWKCCREKGCHRTVHSLNEVAGWWGAKMGS